MSYSNVDPTVTEFPYITSEASVNNAVQCEVKTELINNTNNDIVFKNLQECEYFYNYIYTVTVDAVPTLRTLKSCLKCKFGFTGKITQASEANNSYYINQCTSLTNLTQNNCTDKKYENLNPLWAKFFTCHLCATPSQIPVLFAKFESLSDFQTSVTFDTYSEDSTTDWTSGSSTTTLKCIDNSAASFGLSDTSPWYTIS